MPRTLLIAVLALLVLHQDNWLWTNDYLVFGFMPIGLFYHACISIAASCVWFYAVKICWPERLERLAEDHDTHVGGKGGAA